MYLNLPARTLLGLRLLTEPIRSFETVLIPIEQVGLMAGVLEVPSFGETLAGFSHIPGIWVYWGQYLSLLVPKWILCDATDLNSPSDTPGGELEGSRSNFSYTKAWGSFFLVEPLLTSLLLLSLSNLILLSEDLEKGYKRRKQGHLSIFCAIRLVWIGQKGDNGRIQRQ